jgi:hypothetical protein
MGYPICAHVIEPDLQHVVGKCEACGGELRINERGPHGIGFNVRKEDQVGIPRDLLKLSLNPLKSTAACFASNPVRRGLRRYAPPGQLRCLGSA